MSYLQMVIVRNLYIYSIEIVLSAELSQAVTKELVTNRLTFNL